MHLIPGQSIGDRTAFHTDRTTAPSGAINVEALVTNIEVLGSDNAPFVYMRELVFDGKPDDYS